MLRARMVLPTTRRPRPALHKIADGRFLPVDTPPDVVGYVVEHRHGRAPERVPDLGVPLDPARHAAQTEARRKANPGAHGTHKLVVLGDSLSHGVKHAGIEDTDLSWGAILGAELGATYNTPDFDLAGGLPFNLEPIARAVEASARPGVPWRDVPRAFLAVRQYFATAYDAWVDGPGKLEPMNSTPGVRIHALAQSGFDLVDAMVRTETTERLGIEDAKRNRWFPHVPDADARASARTLSFVHDEAGRPCSFTQGAAVLGRNGGIDTLVVALGANNALRSVVDLRIKWSHDGYDRLDSKKAFNVWTPEHFRASYRELVGQLRKVNAERVVLCTVPHVTIAPIAQGIGGKDFVGSRYFHHYAYPWRDAETFNPLVDRHLTAADARAIDGAIDCYNEYITACVRQARHDGLDWYLFDLADELDRLATKRFAEDPHARPPWWKEPELPTELASLGLDTLFYGSVGKDDPEPAGWFSLDGVHANTVGYSYLAWRLANLLQDAGVTFPKQTADGRVAFDFQRWIDADTVLAEPMDEVPAILHRVNQVNRAFNRVLRPARTIAHTLAP